MGKRGTDHVWDLIKYRGDSAIYAKCKCGYHYNCGRNRRDDYEAWSLTQVPTVFYPYCPSCGARKKWVTEEITKSKIDVFDVPMYGKILDMSRTFY